MSSVRFENNRMYIDDKSKNEKFIKGLDKIQKYCEKESKKLEAMLDNEVGIHVLFHFSKNNSMKEEK